MDFVLNECDSTSRVQAIATDALRRGGQRGSVTAIAFLVAILVTPELHSETIRIENASPDTFRYSIRRQADGWSGKALELEPQQQHTFQSPEPLVVSYWTDKARFATLQPGRTYRIQDTRRGELGSAAAAREPPAAQGVDTEPPGGEPPADAHLRVVKVLAVADSTYRRTIDDWKQRIRDAVQGASEFYESNFGIRFVVTAFQSLDYKALNDKPADRWKRLLRLSPGEADVLVAFIGFGDYYRSNDGAFYIGHLGQGMPFGQHAMVSGERFVHPNRDRAVLIHELAHLFGAFHVQNDSSVMQRGYGDIPTQDIIQGKLRIDAPLKEVLMLTRNVDFQQGVESLTPETRSRIQSLCRQYRDPAESDSPDPIEMGYRYLSSRKEAMNQVEAEPQQSSLPNPQE